MAFAVTLGVFGPLLVFKLWLPSRIDWYFGDNILPAMGEIKRNIRWSAPAKGLSILLPARHGPMDEVYRDIYSQLYITAQIEPVQERELRLSRQWPGTELDAVTLRKLIDEAEQETFGGAPDRVIIGPYTGRRLRPDARLFLLTNFLQMIVLPVSLSRRRNDQDLSRLLFADTVTLLKESANETRERDVSSHAVLKALTKNWQRLNVSALKLWED